MRRRTARALLPLAVGLALAATVLPAAGAKRPVKTTTGAPTYTTYVAPKDLGGDAGEPSAGVNWETGAMFLQAGFTTARLSADRLTWDDASSQTTSQLVSLDPYGFTDPATGRTFVSQLAVVGSLMEFSDDDGETWSPSQGSGVPAGADHQTVGGGPYPPEGSAGPLTAYPHAVYYCSQDVATALCARSDTGGLTFGTGVPVYTLRECWGLHGHVKVAPDGTVYLPNSDCGDPLLTGAAGRPAVAVSRDAGLTWTLRYVPGHSNAWGDPSVGIGRDGTVYLSYLDDVGAVRVSMSRDRGATWSTPVDVGKAFKVVNASFPTAVAGDGDRAAVAFLGTTTTGDGQDPDFGKDKDDKKRYDGATFHLYIATTYDRGATWTTVDVTRSDPVQRGRVCMGGAGCSGGDRNLLDFMDATVDRQGRVVVAWADGCTGTCLSSDLVAANTHTAVGALTRQASGLPLYRTPPPLARR